MAEYKKVIKVDADVDNANKKLKGTKDELTNIDNTTKDTNNSVSGLSESLDNMTGGAISGLKGFLSQAKTTFVGSINLVSNYIKGLILATSSTLGFSKATRVASIAAKGLAVALAATGITLIVAALVGLVEWMKNSREGAQLLETVMNALGAVVGQVASAFSKLLKGDILGAASDIRDIGKAIKESADATNALFEAEDKLFKLRSKNIVQNQKLKNNQEELRKTIEDTTLSDERRIDAIEKLNKVNSKLLTNRQEELKLEREILQANIDNENNEDARREMNLELQQILADELALKGELERVDEEAERKRREIEMARTAEEQRAFEQKKSQLQAEKDLRNELLNETEKARIANIDNEKERIEAEFQLTIEGIRKKYGEGTELEMQLTKSKNQKILDIEREAINKLNDLDKTEKDKKLDSLEESLQREMDLINQAGLSPEAEAERKLAAERRYTEGLAEIERNKQERIKEIINEYLPEDEIGLTEQEKFEKKREERLKQLETELEDLDKSEKQKADIIAKYNKETEKGSKEAAEQDKENVRIAQEAKVRFYAEGMVQIAEALGKGSEAAKAFAAAETLYSTYQGIAKAVGSAPFPANVPAIAFAAATGFNALKSIFKTKSDGSNAQGAASGGASTATSAPTRAPRFDTVGDSQRVRDAQNERGREPVKAYVVSKDITTQQELDRNRNNNSKFL